ncbi:GspH/FimT family pseudopilin [methane-oxidizing endosymbiont of Gigantopelta aegis]|uniref:GspH/FimT family pseudopilin n=1 Tax=methane-oxidizing endosymbiont of Gigantopelta aegis TaxID=2794938 RepID=UPI0018DB34A2|nr:GspH/FimT family pseudopilin [methane-oxidizing endosymbiont of Gigantopelta aegis]
MQKTTKTQVMFSQVVPDDEFTQHLVMPPHLGRGKVRALSITSRGAGFTLIELLMVMAIMSIILSIGVPSFQSMITNNRLTTQANSMVGALNIARSEAVKRNQLLVVGKTGTDWKDGWQVFVDANSNQTFDTGEEVIRKYSGITSGFFINSSSSFDNYVAYRPDGRSNTNGHFYFCSPSQQAIFRKVVVAASGRIRTETSKNSSETYSGVCS